MVLVFNDRYFKTSGGGKKIFPVEEEKNYDFHNADLQDYIYLVQKKDNINDLWSLLTCYKTVQTSSNEKLTANGS